MEPRRKYKHLIMKRECPVPPAAPQSTQTDTDTVPTSGEIVECQDDLNHNKSTNATEAGPPGIHKPSKGGEHIPPTPLEGRLVSPISLCAVFQLMSGVGLLTCGAAITVVSDTRGSRGVPALWWTGGAPAVSGMMGIHAALTKNRFNVFRWGMISLLIVLTQVPVMGVIGNFSIGLYNVWPFVHARAGHPVCSEMTGRCYCQDYYHGTYSKIEMSGVQYIHEDVRWKDTGYKSCDDVRLVSALYYATMACIGLYILCSFIGWIVSLVGSVCAKPGPEFHLLEENYFPDELVTSSMSNGNSVLSVIKEDPQEVHDNEALDYSESQHILNNFGPDESSTYVFRDTLETVRPVPASSTRDREGGVSIVSGEAVNFERY